MSAVVAEEQALEPLPPVKGFMFDLDGTLLLSDRSLGGYEILPGSIEVLTAPIGPPSRRPSCAVTVCRSGTTACSRRRA